ncbi:hypothetical protein OG21DRAFT_1607383 [Imleria badia]|nr:hypothetical protein OG21DRAFT_1607383 [Imleria badia]
MQITPEQVRDILNSNDGNHNVHIASFSEIKSTSYSYTASWESYHIALSDADRSYLLLASPLTPSHPHPRSGRATPPGPITLPDLSILLSKILDTTAVPVPRPVAHDVSGGDGKWHFGWLLLRVPSSSQTHPPTLQSLASVRHRLSPRQRARVELRLGTHLRALHGITNDWFGIPMDKPTPDPPSVPSFAALLAAIQTGEDGEGDGEDMTPYSWQDTFVLQLEELLDYVCGDAEARKTVPSGYTVGIDVDELRRALFRAIGSFLFDDVEMPRLIWVTGNEEDVIVSLTPGEGKKQGSDGEEDMEADIAYILPTFGRALWGDPLMEAWFMPPGPTTAVHEGYFEGEEDGTLIVFPRHKTKRTWYTVYLALLVLAEEDSVGEGEKFAQASDRERIQWARSILPECAEILKNAPLIFSERHLDVRRRGCGCLTIVTCEFALDDFLLVTALTLDICHFRNIDIMVFHMRALLANTGIPLEFFRLWLFDLDALFPVKLVPQHDHGTDCTLDTVIVCIPYFHALANDIVVPGRGLTVLALQAVGSDGTAGEHALCETTHGSVFHAKDVGRLLVAEEWYEVVVELEGRWLDGGWHELKTACIDGSLQGLDRLDDLVRFEPERLELSDGKHVHDAMLSSLFTRRFAIPSVAARPALVARRTLFASPLSNFPPAKAAKTTAKKTEKKPTKGTRTAPLKRGRPPKNPAEPRPPKQEKAKRVRIPERLQPPKRAPGPYFLFYSSFVKSQSQASTLQDYQELSKRAGEIWRGYSIAEKQPFYDENEGRKAQARQEREKFFRNTSVSDLKKLNKMRKAQGKTKFHSTIKPSMPVTPFISFSNEFRNSSHGQAIINETSPEKRYTVRAVLAAADRWRSMSAEEKAPYFESFKKAKEELKVKDTQS